MSVSFVDNTAQVQSRMNAQIQAFLYEAGGELASQAKTNSRVDTGQTKGSYTYKVDTDSDGGTVTVGSSLENAIWEEFGTGEYALNGDGRKGGWVYCDAKGNFYHTYGKRPNRPLYKAFISSYTKIRRRLETLLGDL